MYNSNKILSNIYYEPNSDSDTETYSDDNTETYENNNETFNNLKLKVNSIKEKVLCYYKKWQELSILYETINKKMQDNCPKHNWVIDRYSDDYYHTNYECTVCGSYR